MCRKHTLFFYLNVSQVDRVSLSLVSRSIPMERDKLVMLFRLYSQFSAIYKTLSRQKLISN